MKRGIFFRSEFDPKIPQKRAEMVQNVVKIGGEGGRYVTKRQDVTIVLISEIFDNLTFGNSRPGLRVEAEVRREDLVKIRKIILTNLSLSRASLKTEGPG